jgi:hypothetical protein
LQPARCEIELRLRCPPPSAAVARFSAAKCPQDFNVQEELLEGGDVWVQCEACDAWRRAPPDVPAGAFYCSMLDANEGCASTLGLWRDAAAEETPSRKRKGGACSGAGGGAGGVKKAKVPKGFARRRPPAEACVLPARLALRLAAAGGERKMVRMCRSTLRSLHDPMIASRQGALGWCI